MECYSAHVSGSPSAGMNRPSNTIARGGGGKFLAGGWHRILILGLLLAVIMLAAPVAAESWTPADFTSHYRVYVNGTPVELTDYQVKLVLHNVSGTNLGEKIYLPDIAQPSYNDIRFALDDGTALNYWMETPIGTSNAIFWVKVPSILAGIENSVALNIYYGNATIESESNGDATFPVFDHFDEASLNTNKWSIISGSPTISDSKLVMKGSMVIDTQAQFLNNASIRTYANLYGHTQRMSFGEYSGNNACIFGVGAAKKATIYTKVDGTIIGVSAGDLPNSYQKIELFWNKTKSAIQTEFNPYTIGSSNPVVVLPVSLMSSGSNTGYYDWIFVRQLADTEPALVFTSQGVTPPVSDFSAGETVGTAPLTVHFTDKSTNSPILWMWDFNDDGIVDSTEQNPTYVYSNTGNYSVNLTVKNAGGSNSLVKTDYITVTSSPPVANFSIALTEGYAPLTVIFTDSSTGTVTNWSWDFDNDGTMDSDKQNPSHTYYTAGNYTVNLTVTGPDGSNSIIKSSTLKNGHDSAI